MKKGKKSDGLERIESSFKRKCPYVDEPFDYCYCSSTNSLNVKNVIMYCGGKFEDCEIYKNTMKPDTFGKE